MNLYYTGIGSRSTPPDICSLMTKCAKRFHELGFILRSGGASGADQAFQRGCSGKAEIFLPSPDFQEEFQAKFPPEKTIYRLSSQALKLASETHPAWDRCTPYARLLHARNTYQVLGEDLNTPTLLVLCWTPEGEEKESQCTIRTGGTATAIRLADRRGIPVFNLYNPDALSRLKALLQEKGILP